MLNTGYTSFCDYDFGKNPGRDNLMIKDHILTDTLSSLFLLEGTHPINTLSHQQVVDLCGKFLTGFLHLSTFVQPQTDAAGRQNKRRTTKTSVNQR
jgi:hypothetical protein